MNPRRNRKYKARRAYARLETKAGVSGYNGYAKPPWYVLVHVNGDGWRAQNLMKLFAKDPGLKRRFLSTWSRASVFHW